VFLKGRKIGDQSGIPHLYPSLRDEIFRKFRSGFFKSGRTKGAEDLFGAIYHVGNIRLLSLEREVKNAARLAGERIKPNFKGDFIESVPFEGVHQSDLRTDFLELDTHWNLHIIIQNGFGLYILLAAKAIGVSIGHHSQAGRCFYFHDIENDILARSRQSRHPGPSTSLRINSSEGPEGLVFPGFRLSQE
jgi:hypothetical protein